MSCSALLAEPLVNHTETWQEPTGSEQRPPSSWGELSCFSPGNTSKAAALQLSSWQQRCLQGPPIDGFPLPPSSASHQLWAAAPLQLSPALLPAVQLGGSAAQQQLLGLLCRGEAAKQKGCKAEELGLRQAQQAAGQGRDGSICCPPCAAGGLSLCCPPSLLASAWPSRGSGSSCLLTSARGLQLRLSHGICVLSLGTRSRAGHEAVTRVPTLPHVPGGRCLSQQLPGTAGLGTQG